MEWRPSMVLKEAEAVLTTLRLTGVNVRLEGEDRNKAIKVIESFLKRYKNCCWPILMIEITGAIRREILKSRNVIDVNMVSQVADYLSNGGVVKKKKEKKDGSGSDEETYSDEEQEEEYNWKDEPDRYLGSDEEEEDSGFEDDSEEDEAQLKKAAAAAAEAAAEEEQELKDLQEQPRRKGYIEDLIRLSEKKGLSVKKEDEDKIFEMMIPYILGGRGYYDHWMEIFLRRVREHIDRCSSLDNVDTIKTALESEDFFSFEDDHWKIIEQNTTREEEEDMADAKDQVNHSVIRKSFLSL